MQLQNLSIARNVFIGKIFKKLFNQDKTFYELYSEFFDFWTSDLGYKSIIKKDCIKEFIKTNLNGEIEFIKDIKRHAYHFDDVVYSQEVNRFINDVKFENLFNYYLDLDDVKEYSLNVSCKSLLICKEYFIGLEKFYNDNPGFQYILDRFFATRIKNPLIEYFSKDINIYTYTNDTNRYLYLKLIKDFIDSSNFKIPEKENEEIRNNLKLFIKSENRVESQLATNLRLKLYRYNDLKPPDYLNFHSIINDDLALELSKYLIESKFVDPSINVKSLQAFFKGKLSIVSESYIHNFSYIDKLSVAIKVKSKKLGYVAFALDYLWKENYLQCKNLWKILEENRFFINNNGKPLNRNDFARALSDKKNSRNKAAKKRITNCEIENLHGFLKEYFPNIT